MTVFNFQDYVGQTITGFDVDVDVLSIDSNTYGAASGFTFNISGTDLVLTASNGNTVTLAGVSIREITGNNVNFSDTSLLQMGDGTTDAFADDGADTLTNSSNSADNIWGFGGADVLTVSGNGANYVQGNEGDDDITISGDGNNTVRGGAGNEDAGLGTGAAFGILISGDGNNIVRGDTGNDNIEVTGDGNNIVYGDREFGDTGTDRIDIIGDGNNTVYGGVAGGTADVDTINIDGDGNNLANGNTGDDNIDVDGNGNNTIRGGSGDDTVNINGTGNNIVRGDTGGDTINVAGTGNNLVYGDREFGDTGDDTITVTGSGNNTIIGGVAGGTADVDTISLTATATGDNFVQGNTGDDIITYDFDATVTTTDTTLRGGSGDDTFTLTDNGNGAFGTLYVRGDTGDDTVDVTLNSTTAVTGVTLEGGAGADTYEVDISGAAHNLKFADFDATNDILNLDVGTEGSTAVDLVVSRAAGSTQIVLDGGASDEILTFQSFSGNFNSTNFVLSDGTILQTNFAGAAATLTGSANADQLVAGDSGDTLVSGGGDDKLVGGTGADTFQFTGAQADGTAIQDVTIAGGSGVDTLEVTSAAVDGTLNIVDADFADITSVEVLKLADEASTITVADANAGAAGLTTINGSALTSSNVLTLDATGFTTALTITGGAGNDVVSIDDTKDNNVDLGAGDDTLSGVSGVAGAGLFDLAGQTLQGGAGTDTLNEVAGTSNSFDGTKIGGWENIDIDNDAAVGITFAAGYNATVATGVDVTVTNDGSGGALTINGSALTVDLSATGDTGADSLVGGSGADTLTGAGGTDTLKGNAGADLIDGGAAADTILGGDGADTIIGGAAGDTLTGGAGVDHFRYSALADAGDNILDFSVGASGDVVSFLSTATPFGGLDADANYVESTGGALVGGSTDASNSVLVLTDSAGYANFAAAEAVVEAANTATADYVLVFWNSTNSAVEVHYDADDSSNANGNTFLATLDTLAATDLTGFTDDNFAMYS